MVAFSKVKAGDTLYDVHRVRMGNTKVSRNGLWLVRVIEVNSEKREALCSWNSNTPTWWSEKRLGKLKAKKPEPKGNFMGMPSY